MNRTLLQILIMFAIVMTFGLAQHASELPDQGYDDQDDSSQVADDVLGLERPLELLIYSEEIASGRRIAVVKEASSQHIIVKPEVELNPNTGEFNLLISGVANTVYTGARRVQEHGKHPIQYEIRFVEEDVLEIKGRTFAFEDMDSRFDFDTEAYLFDFSYAPQNEAGGKTNLVADQTTPLGRASAAPVDPAPRVPKREKALNSMVLTAITFALYALGAIIAIMVLTLLIRRLKQRAPAVRENFGDVLAQKAGEAVSSVPEASDTRTSLPLTAAEKEDRIRELMAGESISYDEAALRVQYEELGAAGEAAAQ